MKIVLAVALLCLAACGAPASDTLKVCAAASLKRAFEDLSPEFVRGHAPHKVELNFAGSQTLRAQIEAGAPCDVIATADEQTMQALVTGERVDTPQRFASNGLVIVTPLANAAGLVSWRDLMRAPRIALAAPEVPIGKYARRFLESAERQLPGYAKAVDEHVKTLELDVAHVMMRVRRGEVDAAIAYRTDAMGDGEVATIAVPGDLDVPADYPIAVVRASARPALAKDFVAFVLAPEGRAFLAKRGFMPPRTTATP